MNSSVLSRDVVLAALKNGFTDSQIATSCRVTQSAISQYIDAHGLRQHASVNSKFETIDAKYNKLEEKVLDKLASSMEYAVLDPVKLSNVLTRVNSAKRRSMSEGAPQVNITDVRLVNIRLPQHVKVKAQLNAMNEVIQIGERNIITMGNDRVDQLALEHQNEKQIELSDLL